VIRMTSQSQPTPDARTAAQVLVVMGVSGSGKSTVAALIAEKLGWIFVDGDSFHTPEHVAKMRAGHALDDADRAPWLARIATWIQQRLDAGRPGAWGGGSAGEPSLLDSQFATLEVPGADEHPITVGILEPPEAIADRVVAELAAAARRDPGRE